MNFRGTQYENNTLLRVLYVNGGTMDYGGISTYMMNYYRHFNRNRIQIDFVVHGQGGIYDDEIIKLGGQVFHVPTKRQNMFENQRTISKIMDKGKYQIIHSHTDAMNGVILKKAKKHNIPIRIAHSHNTDYLTNNRIKRLFHEYSRKIIPKYATHMFACSEMAGNWLYGDSLPFEVIHNAIDLDKYSYNRKIREKLRQDLDLSDKYIVGHVGRFDYQKNHEFLIKVFAKYSKINHKARLVLIGDGELRKEIEEQIKYEEIDDKVILLGKRTDVCALLNIFDVFVFPSRFEGLGIVAIEAQANGLPCIVSSEIPPEAIVAGRNIKLKLNIDDWVCALEYHKYKRQDNIAELREAGYDINFEANRLQEIYFTLMQERDAK